MKFNSILLFIFCLLQALICSTDGLNEQTLIDATNKILKYAKIYHENILKLEDKENLYDLKLNCPSLILDNIQFSFDENGNLHIKFVNLRVVVTGKYEYGIGFSKVVNDFSALLNNFYWEIVFAVSKKELENEKLEITFKQTATSRFIYDILLINSNAKNIELNNLNINLNVEDSLKEQLKKNLNLYVLAKQLEKVSLLIIETIKSD